MRDETEAPDAPFKNAVRTIRRMLLALPLDERGRAVRCARICLACGADLIINGRVETCHCENDE